MRLRRLEPKPPHSPGTSRALLLLLPVLAACAMPEPARGPEKVDFPRMTRVAVQDVSPGADPALAEGPPVVIHRMGEKYGRVDYPPHPQEGTHRLVVVREPHAFVIDRVAGIAYHGIDEGPTYVFRAPVLGNELRRQVPAPLGELEFGKELEFLRAHGAKSRRLEGDSGRTAREYRLELPEDHLLVVVTRGTPEVPVWLGVLQGRRLLQAYRYQEYRTDLLPSPGLFQVPEGVEIVPAPVGDEGAGAEAPAGDAAE